MPDFWPTVGGLQPFTAQANPAQVGGIVAADYYGTIYAANTLSRWVGLNYQTAGTITHDSTSYGPAVTGSTLSWKHTIGSGTYRTLLVTAGITDTTNTNTVTSVTFNGINLYKVKASSITSEADDAYLEIWSLGEMYMPSPGTYTITVTLSATPTSGLLSGISSSYFNCNIQGIFSNSSAIDAIGQGINFTTYLANAVSYNAVIGSVTTTNGPWSGPTTIRQQSVGTGMFQTGGNQIGPTFPVFKATGGGTSTTSSATYQGGVGATVYTGEYITVFITCNNAEASGGSSISSVTDVKSHTYTKLVGENQTAASAANDGVTVEVWTAPCTSQMAASDNITVNFSPNTSSKVVIFGHCSSTTGPYAGGTSKGSGTTPTGANITPNKGNDLIIGICGMEANTTGTGDSDTYGGAWSSSATQTANTGTSGTSISYRRQQKTVVTTDQQTYNPASTPNSDWAIVTFGFGCATAGFTSLSSTLNATTIVPVGTLMVVEVSAPNASTNGTTCISSITDSKSHTWTQQADVTYSPNNTPGDGISFKVYTAMCNTQLNPGDTITANFSLTIYSGAINCAVAYGVSGAVSSVSTVGSGGSPSISSTPAAAGDIVFGCHGTKRYYSGNGDTDTLNGDWSGQINTYDANAVYEVAYQYKVVNATGTQSYDPTNLVSTSNCAVVFSIAGLNRHHALATGESPIATAGAASNIWTSAVTQGRIASITLNLEPSTNYVTEDWDGFHLHINGGGGLVRKEYLFDIGIGEGGNQVVVFSGIYTTGQVMHPGGGENYNWPAAYPSHAAHYGMFPIHIKKNQQIWIRLQSSGASQSQGIAFRLSPYIMGGNLTAGGPGVVDTLGLTVASSRGTDLSTTASNTWGAWAEIVASTDGPYYAIAPRAIARHNVADWDQGSRTARVKLQIGVGTAGSEVIIADFSNVFEEAILPAPWPWYYVQIPKGTRVAARWLTTSTDNPSKISVVVHALRGA